MIDFDHWRIPGLLLILVGTAALGLSEVIRHDEWTFLGGLLVATGLVLLPAIWRVMRRDVEEVLGDHLFVLAGSFIAYYVLGALLIPFGPHDQVQSSLSYYGVDAPLAMRVTAVNNIGFGLALIAGSMTGRRLISRMAQTVFTLGRSIAPQWVIVLFLFIGGASAVQVTAYEIGLRTEVVSGLVRTMSQLLLVAVIVAAAQRGRGSVWFVILAIVLTVVQSLAGLLVFSKSGVLLPLMALLVGLTWRLGARRVIVPGVVLLLGVFLLIGNPVTTARNIFGVGNLVDGRERVAVLWEGLLRLTDPSSPKVDYQALSRFSYLLPQGTAVHFHDTDRGGDDYNLLGWVFLPRVLFPDKPILTESGTEFYFKISGHEGSSEGQGVFVNGYYNLGWWGVIIVGIAVGCILACTSAMAEQVFRSRALLWLPLALVGALMAFRIDGAFLTDYWGPFVLIGYIFLFSVVLKRLLESASR